MPCLHLGIVGTADLGKDSDTRALAKPADPPPPLWGCRHSHTLLSHFFVVLTPYSPHIHPVATGLSPQACFSPAGLMATLGSPRAWLASGSWKRSVGPSSSSRHPAPAALLPPVADHLTTCPCCPSLPMADHPVHAALPPPWLSALTTQPLLPLPVADHLARCPPACSATSAAA